MYKVTNGLSPEIMNGIFQIREESRYNLRYTSQFTIPPIHSVYNGRESVSFMGPNNGSLYHPLSSKLILSQDLKQQLRNGSLVTAPTDFVKRIYLKLVSYRFKF